MTTLRHTALSLACALAALPFSTAATADPEPANGPAEGALPLTESVPTTEEAKTSRFEQEVVVTATHPEEFSSLVTAAEIRDEPTQDLGQLLRGQPGMSAWRRGPINLDPSVRGLQESQIGVFVDGTRTFAAGPGRMDSGLSHVHPEAVGRLEVVKGPYALTWGAGALAAIRVETSRPPFSEVPTTGGRVGTRYDENGDRGGLYADAWAAAERYRFDVSGSHRDGEDYETGAGATVPAAYASEELRWAFDWRPSRNTLLEYSGGDQQQDDIDYAGRQLDASYFTARSHSLRFSRAFDRGTLDRLMVQAYSNEKTHRMNNDAKPSAQPNPDRMPPFGLDVDLPTASDTTGARAQIAGARQSWSWLAGADAGRVEQRAERFIRRRDNGMLLFRDIVWPDAELDNIGAYGQISSGGEHYTVTATLRADLSEAAAGATSEFFLSTTDQPLSQSESDLSFAVSTRRVVSARSSWAFGVGSAARSPNTLERYSDRFPSSRFQVTAEFVGDPGLRSERSNQLDFGYRFDGDRVSLRAETFARRIDDYITVEPDPDLPRRLPGSLPLVFRFVNGKASFYGLEASLLYRVSAALSLRGAVQSLRGDDDELDEPAFGQPADSLSLGLRFTQRRGWADAELRMVDDQTRVSLTRLEAPTEGYEILDFGLGLDVGDQWSFRLGVENATDEEYSEHLNSFNPFNGTRIPERGRSVNAGVALTF